MTTGGGRADDDQTNVGDSINNSIVPATQLPCTSASTTPLTRDATWRMGFVAGYNQALADNNVNATMFLPD
jgi:hypothetical protein